MIDKKQLKKDIQEFIKNPPSDLNEPECLLHLNDTYWTYDRCGTVSDALKWFLKEKGYDARDVDMWGPKFIRGKRNLKGLHEEYKTMSIDKIGHTVVVIDFDFSNPIAIDLTAAQFGQAYRRCCSLTDFNKITKKWSKIDPFQ